MKSLTRLLRPQYSNVILTACTSLTIISCQEKSEYFQARFELWDKNISFNQDSFFLCVKSGNTEALKLFRKAGFDFNTKDEFGNTALIVLVPNNKAPNLTSVDSLKLSQTIELLINSGANINEINEFGETAIIKAVAYSNTFIANLLIDFGADFRIKDRYGIAPIFIAIKNDNLELVTVLFNSYLTSGIAESSIGEMLSHAVDNNSMKTIKFLLAREFDVNLVNQLLSKAVANGNLDLVRLLLKSNVVNVNERNNWGETPLMIAVNQNNLAIAEILLKSGANPNGKDNNEKTALMSAVANRSLEITNILLRWNVNLNEKNKDGETAIFYSIDNEKITNLLLNHGADVNVIEERNGRTPLMLAAQRGAINVVKSLLKHGADTNILDRNGLTALTRTISEYGSYYYKGDLELFEVLAANSNINIKNSHGLTPLMIASQNSKSELVKFLLKNGAKINDEDNSGQTALIHAAKSFQLSLLYHYDGSNSEISDTSYYEVIKTLLSYRSVDINKADSLGKTALMYAVNVTVVTLGMYSIGTYNRIAQLLLEHGAEANLKDNNGYTALMYAAGFNRKPIPYIKGPTEAAKPSYWRRKQGNIEIQERAYECQDSTVELLLKYGADPTIKLANGKTVSSMDYCENINDILEKAKRKRGGLPRK